MQASETLAVFDRDDKPCIMIGKKTYALSIRFDRDWFRAELDCFESGAHHVAHQAPTGEHCSCDSFRYGRKIADKRVFGPCKHLIKLTALVGFLRALGLGKVVECGDAR